MHTIDVEPAQGLAHILRDLGLDAEACYGDIGELRALAHGPYIRIWIGPDHSAKRKRDSLQGLLLDFYTDCGLIDLDRQLLARRLPQLRDLLLVPQFTEFFDVASETDVVAQLTAANQEFARFTEYLKDQVKKHAL